MINYEAFSYFEYELVGGGVKILGFRDEVDSSEFSTLYIPEGTVSIGEDAFFSEEFCAVHFPKSLVEIGECAFSYCEELCRVTFDYDCKLRYIRKEAFENTRIEKIELPRTVEMIGEGAFTDCAALSSVNFTDLTRLKKIESDAFYACRSLRSAILPTGLKTLGEGVFSGCASLSTVGLPSTLEEAGGDVFCDCTALTTITADLDEIPFFFDEYFLDGCNAKIEFFGSKYTPMSQLILKPYIYGEGKYTLVAPITRNIKKLDLHPDIVDIAPRAFMEHLELESFKANCPYIVIGAEAFLHCSCLTSVDFTDGTVCKDAFAGTAVKHAIIARGSEIGAYRNSAASSFSLSEGFSDSSFASYVLSATRIKELTVPDKITSIAHHAFFQCVRLERVDLNRVETLAESAFEFCTALKEIIFPENKLLVWDNAFKDCLDLPRVEIPEGTNITRGMFSGCRSLGTVIIRGRRDYLNVDAFHLCPITRLELRDSLSSKLEKYIPDLLSESTIPDGESIRIIFKDKTVTKTKVRRNYWK